VVGSGFEVAVRLANLVERVGLPDVNPQRASGDHVDQGGELWRRDSVCRVHERTGWPPSARSICRHSRCRRFAGELDPATPATEAARVAGALGSGATFVQFPTLGHGVVFANAACPTQVANAFLANPSAVVDTACLSTMPPVVWAE